MKVLITGANGFVAHYLAKELKSHAHEVFLTGKDNGTALSLPYLAADLTDPLQVDEVIQWSRPDALVHLAGISHVGQANADRAGSIIAANVDATQYLCRSLHQQSREAIFLFVSTGLVYKPQGEKFLGYDEDGDLGPVNDYGWSKLAAEAVVRIYKASGIRGYIARPFNHTGPGQDFRFVCPSLAQRVILAEDYTSISVGNLAAKRDFTDVRDIVKAYRLILEKRPEESVFVLGSGKAVEIKSILDFFVTLSRKNLSLDIASELFRKEHDVIFGRPDRAKELLGWEPTIPLEQTLKDLYDSLNSRT